jgi:cell division control protein 7
MTLSDTRSYVSELLTGLQSAHQTGIMHRDVKPGNFLYSKKTKRGYLADFGLAQQSSLELYTPKHNSQLSDSQIEYTQDQAGYYHNDSR